MRRVIAAVIAGVAVFAAVGGSVATAGADAQCTGQDEPNPLTPDAYQKQYNATIAKPVTEGLKAFNAAVATNDTERTGQAAGLLSTQISMAPMMFGTRSPFGCYDPGALSALQQATSTFSAALDAISGAAAGLNKKKPTDVPGLVMKAKPLQAAYLDALNAYAAQFGGQQVPTKAVPNAGG